jgi:hypothetical protein
MLARLLSSALKKLLELAAAIPGLHYEAGLKQVRGLFDRLTA